MTLTRTALPCGKTKQGPPKRPAAKPSWAPGTDPSENPAEAQVLDCRTAHFVMEQEKGSRLPGSPQRLVPPSTLTYNAKPCVALLQSRLVWPLVISGPCQAWGFECKNRF